jgi:hypothetical protein
MEHPFMDKALARRLERTEGAINASFVETHARMAPECLAVWRDFAGTHAMFDGEGSPMTQTFGLGLFEPVAGADLAGIERFFFERGAGAPHEVSSLAGVETTAMLVARGYVPVESSTVLVRRLGHDAAATEAGPVRARAAEGHEADTWVDASARGWSEHVAVVEQIRAIATLAFHNPRMTSFFAEREGRPIATGSLGAHEGVALLAGASTLADERGRGAQRVLLAERLRIAKERGCDVAMIVTEPGSGSQRNAERNGFLVAYTRTKWKLART